MRLFIRLFSQAGHLNNWLEKEPPLSKLLQCFDVKRESPRPDPSSVFAIEGDLQALEAAAAFFQTAPRTPEKSFGVVITEKDCESAGVAIDVTEPGTTGIAQVDKRHASLIGEQEGFAQLMVCIVREMWEGAQRLKMFPAHQIVGQVAIFSKLDAGEIHEESREQCKEILSMATDWHRFVDGGDVRVEVLGKLKERIIDCSVRASRDCSSACASPSSGLGSSAPQPNLPLSAAEDAEARRRAYVYALLRGGGTEPPYDENRAREDFEKAAGEVQAFSRDVRAESRHSR